MSDGTNAPVKRRRPVRRIVSLVLLCYLVYFIVGMLVPFTVQPEVSAAFQSTWDPAALYGQGSPDRAALVFDNVDALDIRLRMIAEARERVIFTSFDIRDVESGRDIFSALLDAADRGVEIQILTDGLNGFMGMSRKPVFRALGRLPNVEIRYYNEPNLLAPWRMNGRMHDKYIIVDDRLLLLGGRNTFDLFLGDYVPDAQKSHDQDVLVVNTAAGTGSAASVLFQVEDYFSTVWNSPDTKTVLDTEPLLNGPVDDAAEMLRARYAAMKAARPTLFDPAPLDYSPYTVPVEGAALLHNPINILSKEPWVWWQIQQLMEGAETRAYVQTPYAVLNAPMYEGLRRVAEKGIETGMQLNSVAVGDNFMASSDYVHNRDKVIETGFTVWEWFGDYSSHGKAALIDDDLALIGSYNWDLRSTYVDTELMLVFHGAEFSSLLSTELMAMEEDCLQATVDGYVTKPGLSPEEVEGLKAGVFAVTSRLFQPFRFLI